MSALTPERLAEIRERATAATEGPWGSHDFGYAGEEEPSSIVVHTGEFDHSDLLTYDTETAVAWMPRWERQESDNATFIAYARTDVPALLAEVDRLREGVERVRGHVHESWLTQGDVGLIEDALDGCDALLNPTGGEADE